MISVETERRLAELLYQFSKGENRVEIIRKNLCKNNDFEPYSAFRQLDRLGLGSLSSSDLRAFLERNNIQITEEDSYMLIRQYDSNSDGRLSLNEFTQLVLPSTNPTLREIAQSRLTKPHLEIETEYLLLRLLENEVETQRDLEAARKELVQRLDFNLLECFKVVDSKNSQKLDRNDLTDFLRKHNFKIIESDIDSIIRRVDNDGDYLISYLEFVDGILPSEPVLRSSIPTSSFRRSTSRTSHNRKPSSPLRKSPSRDTSERHSLQRSILSSAEKEKYSRRASSPLRGSPLRSSVLNYALSPKRSSPLKSSLKQTGEYISKEESLNSQVSFQSPIRITTLRNSSPLRSSPLRTSSITYSSPLRNSYLQSSINEKGSISSSFRSRSPSKSFMKNSSKRENIGVRNSHLSNSSPRKSFMSSSVRDRSYYEDFSSPTKNNTISPNQSMSISRSLRKSYFDANRDIDVGKPNRLSDLSNSRISFADLDNSVISRNSSSMAEYEERELTSLFNEQIKISRDLEKLKIELSIRPDFNLIDSFRMFDLSDRGSVSVNEFESTLKELGLMIVRDEVYLLIRHYSSIHDSVIQFSEFSEMLIPKSDEFSSILRNRIPYNLPIAKRKSVFSRATNEIFLDLLKLHLISESTAESLRQNLSQKKFNLHEAFQIIDKDRNGFITIDEFQSILENHNIPFDRKDLHELMNRYDKNKDGRVSYSEFVQEIAPKSPNKY